MLHEGYDVSARRARSPSPIKQNPRPTASADRPIMRSPHGQNHSVGSVSPKDRFNVAKEKFMNLEREKIDDSDKRAQVRRNLDNILSRGPKTPTELQANSRSNPKWPSDEEDAVLERRAEMPRIVPRNESRERNLREPRDEREYRFQREPRDYRDRQIRDPREYRDMRGAREIKEPLNMRELKEVQPIRDARDFRDFRDSDVRNYKDPKLQRDSRYERDYKDREFRDPRDHKETKDAKYLREFREIDDFRNARHNNEEVRHSRERTPQLEQRYFEYRGERNDKYFDNRYKQESRSDDEGVESEKQFEEIRYVPHVEVPRRREPEPRINKVEPTKKDGRIELLEERQRQMESKRILRPADLDDRYERNLEIQRRSHMDNRDWDVLRRSYAEAERPRRDGRARHSYAEPVARTRVGMATVAPF